MVSACGKQSRKVDPCTWYALSGLKYQFSLMLSMYFYFVSFKNLITIIINQTNIPQLMNFNILTTSLLDTILILQGEIGF